MNPVLYRIAKSVSKPIPKPLFYRLAHAYARREYHRFLQDRLGVYFVPVDPGPPAPPEILLTTRAMNEQELTDQTLTDRYMAGAYKTVKSWLSVVEPYGFNLRTCGAVLEMGCGSARLLRHFRCIQGLRVVGCDVDDQALNWCKANIPGAAFFKNELSPPFKFAPDNSFDFIFAASVFTHVPLDVQQGWVEELRRVLRPGGFFVGTVEGWFNQQRQLTEANRAELRAKGHFTLTKENENASLSTKALGSWDVFQTRSEVIRSYGSILHMRDFLPDKQDLLVLQKPR